MDTLGMILAVGVHAADVQDRDAEDVLARMARRFTRLKVIWADGAYAGEFGDVARRWYRHVIEIVNRPQVSRLVVLPKRWIVERTFRWFSKYRSTAL